MSRNRVQRVPQLPLVVPVVLIGNQVALDHDGDIRGVELPIDHGSVADKTAQPQITLHQRRQLSERTFPVQPVRADAPHVDITALDRSRTQGGGREVIVVEIAQLRPERVRVGAGQARAAEHQVDLVAEHIGRDAAPHQLHDRPAAMRRIHAGASKLEHLAGELQHGRDVVLVGRIEPADLLRRMALD